MRQYQIKTGTAFLPEEWWLVPTPLSGEEDFILVVEMRGGEFPTFFFPSDKPSIGQDKQAEIFRAITRDHPWFQNEVINEQVDAVWQGRRLVNEARWVAAPIIGFFTVPDVGIPYETYPHDAHIVRTADRSPEE